MANQTIIALDLSSSTVTSVTLSDYYASKVNPVLTGYVNAGDATSATLPANTTIGNISSTELSYLDGLTGNIQSQISSISLSGSVSGNVILPAYVAGLSGAIVFEGATGGDDNQLFLIPPNPTYDAFLYLQMPPQPGATDYLVSRQSTDTLTNKTFNTTDNNIFKVNGTSLTNTTGTGNTVLLSTSPSITTPIINSVSLTGYTGTGSTVVLSSSPSIYQPTFSGTVTVYSDLYVGGDLSVNGAVTTINTNTLTVDDKNIELGYIGSGVFSTTGTIGTVTGTGPYIATITNLTGNNVIPGQIITATAGTGTLGSGTVTVASVVSKTSITVSSSATMTAGTITNITGGNPTDLTANGGGITLKGATDKTIIWDNTNSNWTSSENFNVASSKTYKINNSNILSGTGDALVVGENATTSLTLGNATGSIIFANTNKTLNSLSGYSTVFGNTSLTASSGSVQYFNGGSAQTVTLPDTSTLQVGYSFELINAGTGTAALTVQTSTSVALTSVPVGARATLICVSVANNTATAWRYIISGFNNFTGDATASSKAVLDITPTITSPNILTGITTSGTNFNLIDATATTLNIGGAATTLNIGATTGTATINNSILSLANAITINATKITSFDIGSAVTATSNINIGTGVNASGQTKTISIGTNGAASSTTTINIGTSTGTTTVTMNATNLTGNATSMNIFNANQTTIGAFGAAQTLNIGSLVANATMTHSYSSGTVGTTFAKTVNISTGTIAGTTASQTINIATGANSATSGLTNINIGTGALSGGATSTIQIGSTSNTTSLRLNLPTATTIGAAGGASALPATPVGYITVNISGTNYKIPYYNV